MSSGSILAVDFGNVTTRALLIDQVEGEYRLIARGETRTTLGFPVDDVRIGLYRAVQQITAATQRQLVSEVGVPIIPEAANRAGIDHFVATTSTGRTLRTLVIGLVPEVSIAAALRAAAGTYIEVVEQISLADTRNDEDQLNAIITCRPDLIFITGGTEGGAEEPVLRLAALVWLALQLYRQQSQPVILYAGNSALRGAMRQMFGDLATVLTAPNVRPSLDSEVLEASQLYLARAFDERQANMSGHFQELGKDTRLGILPTAQSYQLAAAYLGKTLGGNVLVVDMGSAVSTISASIDGRAYTAIRPDIGLGHSADSLLNQTGEKAVDDWLPFVAKPNQIRHYALNKMLRPASVPENIRGMYFEHGLLRAGVNTLLTAARYTWTKQAEVELQALPPLAVLVGAGAALTATGSPGFNAMLLLDAVQPEGVTELRADTYGLLAVWGALAPVHPQAAVQTLDSFGLDKLGTAISLGGRPKAERPALRIKISLADGTTVKHEVLGGHLWVYSLSVGEEALVDVQSLQGGTNVGGKRNVKFKAKGGSAGLIFDARGRALPVALDVRGRAAQLPQWIAEATGDPLIPIDETWLTDAQDEAPPVETAKPSSKGSAKRKSQETQKVSGKEGKKSGKTGQPSSKTGKTGQLSSSKGKGDDVPMPDDFMSLDDLR